MSRKHNQLQLAGPEGTAAADLEQQIHRLRQMLSLMAPESGSSALGATVPFIRQRQRREQILLSSPDAVNF